LTRRILFRSLSWRLAAERITADIDGVILTMIVVITITIECRFASCRAMLLALLLPDPCTVLAT
jgi:hypothetical protein